MRSSWSYPDAKKRCAHCSPHTWPTNDPKSGVATFNCRRHPPNHDCHRVQHIAPADDRLLVAIQTGGKGDYRDVASFLRSAKQHLAEALFFIDDEYGHVEQWHLRVDSLTITTVADEDSTAARHMAWHLPEHAEFAYELLCLEIFHPYTSNVDSDDVEAMCHIAPHRWQSSYARGVSLARGDNPSAAISWLRDCLARAPEDSVAHANALTNLVDAISHTSPEDALHEARNARFSWIRHQSQDGLKLLASLEELCGEPARAVDAWLNVLGPRRFSEDRDTNRNLYDMARLRVLQGRQDEGLDWLRVALAVTPSLHRVARTDKDLAALWEHPGFATMTEMASSRSDRGEGILSDPA